MRNFITFPWKNKTEKVSVVTDWKPHHRDSIPPSACRPKVVSDANQNLNECFPRLFPVTKCLRRSKVSFERNVELGTEGIVAGQMTEYGLCEPEMRLFYQDAWLWQSNTMQVSVIHHIGWLQIYIERLNLTKHSGAYLWSQHLGSSSRRIRSSNWWLIV